MIRSLISSGIPINFKERATGIFSVLYFCFFFRGEPIKASVVVVDVVYCKDFALHRPNF